MSQPKKDRLPKKNLSSFVESSFDNHAETFQKKYVILLLIFTKTNGSISGKVILLLISFQVKKSPWKI